MVALMMKSAMPDLRDVVLRRCPFDTAAALELIDEIRGAPLLKGARGRPPADVTALAGLLAQVSRLAWDLRDEVESIEMNPVIVLPHGQGAWIADAVIERRP